MHFDITTPKAKARVQAAIVRKQILLERAFRRRMKAILDHEWQVVAQHAEHGIFDVEHVVNSLRGIMLKALSEQYTRVGQVFFESVQASFLDSRGKAAGGPKEQKGMAEEFWQAFHNWTFDQAARKVKLVGDATKSIIRRVIRRLVDEGGSYKVIAEGIREKAGDMNLSRAMRIARTEVHAASTYAVNESVKSTRVKFDREWVSILDERTREDHRKANGQRRGMDEPFDVGGEHLRFPGDPKGSAKNIIQCRCVLIYHTARGVRQVTWE